MYEWLNSYQELEQNIAFFTWELEKYKDELWRWKNPYDLGRYSIVKESRSAKIETLIADLEYKLAIEMNHLCNLKRLIYSFKGLEQHILRMKYVEGLTLKEVADELGYTYDHIRRIHSRILKKVKFKQEYVVPQQSHIHR